MCVLGTMSWFDSSFTFAKSALSQAQKSIDKVLDISDGKIQHEVNGESVGSIMLLSCGWFV